MVTADIIARHSRLVDPDRPVYFLSGTDEHGLKIQNAARKRGLHPQLFCDELQAVFRVCLRPCLPHGLSLTTALALRAQQIWLISACHASFARRTKTTTPLLHIFGSVSSRFLRIICAHAVIESSAKEGSHLQGRLQRLLLRNR